MFVSDSPDGSAVMCLEYRTWGLIMVYLFTSWFPVAKPFGNEILSSYLFAPTRRADYTDNQLFKIYIRTPEDLALLRQWQVELRPLQLDFWDGGLPDQFSPFRTSFLVRVPPQSVKDFTAYLIAAEIDYQILSHDLNKLVQWEKMTVATVQQANRNRGSGLVIPPASDRYPNHRRILLPGVHTLASYLPLESVNNFIDSIVDRHPVMASSFEIGRSFEGRPIRGLKIGTPFVNFGETTFEDPQSVPSTVKKAILIDGAMQGRDWITVPALLYLVQQLLSRYDIDDKARFMLDVYDWYIIPVANPDSYDFTWKTDRFWKKTRSISSPNSTLANPQCRGVDLNKNFAFGWGKSEESDYESSDVCHASFGGDKPFSERESTALAKFMFNNRKQIKIYVTLQNYGQAVLTPYAAKPVLSKDHRNHVLAGSIATRAMHKVHGEHYELGTFAEALYLAGGTAIDWAYEVAKIKYSFQFQLRDRGNWGFILPRNQIIPAAAEFYAGITEMAHFVHFSEMDYGNVNKVW